MAIPDYQSIMLPLLELARDNQEHSLRSAVENLGDKFALTVAERRELLPSGRQATFDNRVNWASTYLKKAGLLKSSRRGYFQITERGHDVLRSAPLEINNDYLNKFEEFREFRKRDNSTQSTSPNRATENTDTPEESLEQAYLALRKDLTQELLEMIMKMPYDFFERLVVDLLVKMGYGGSRKEAGQAVGRANDEGIDGIIKEDRLGLDIIYIQAKKWDGNVGRPEIQKFAGALQGKRAKKGIFLTTSSFTKEALEYVSLIDSKIILVDGKQLADFMIDHNVGVSPVSLYEIKRLDSDYFTES